MRCSAGFVILCPSGMLVGHVTGAKHWDIPKGNIDAGEQALEAAIRELREETGLVYDHDNGVLTNAFTGVQYLVTNIRPLGRHSYKKGKELELFVLIVPSDVDVAALKCESMVVRPTYAFPELDGFALVRGTQTVSINQWLAPAMYSWLREHM